MPIDLPPVAGPMIAAFGRQVSALGEGLANAYNAQQQALLDAESASQVIQAKSLALSTVDQFNQNIDSNPDYQNYGEMWKTQKQGLQDELSKVLKLPDAQGKFNEWWLTEQDKQQNYVYGETRKKTVAMGQANATVAMEQYAVQGNEQGVIDTAKAAVEGGLFTASEASSAAASNLPKARYNSIYQQMDKLGDPTKAVAQLLASSPAELGVTPDQLKELTTSFQFKADSQKKAAADRSEQDGLKSWDEFMTKLQDNSFSSWAEFASYQNLVDKGHQETVRQTIDRARAGLELGPTLAQDTTRDDLMAKVWDWAANGDATTPAPFTPDQVNALAGGDTPKIRAEQAKEVQEALKTADAMRDNKEGSAMYSRLYGSVDNNKNPALEVPISEIDSAIQDPTLHQALLSKRQELQNSYESRSGTTRESTMLEGYNILYSPTMSSEAKKKWFDQHAGNGLSTADAMMLRNKVDPYNDSDRRKLAMNTLIDAYKISMQNPNLSTQKTKDLAVELFKAQNQLDGVFRANPDNPDVWDQQVIRILQNKTTNDLGSLVSAAAGGPVTGSATGEYRAPYKDATALEYLREQGQAPAGAMTEDVIKKAGELELDAFKKATLTNVTANKVVVGGDTVYSDKPIKKDASGRYVVSADNYQVRYQIKNGQYVPTIYHQNPATGAFDVLVWEWK